MRKECFERGKRQEARATRIAGPASGPSRRAKRQNVGAKRTSARTLGVGENRKRRAPKEPLDAPPDGTCRQRRRAVTKNR